MRVLVAGAGYVGAELAVLLARAGHDVLALRRTPRAEAAAPTFAGGGRLAWLAGDLCDPQGHRAAALAGVEALAYLVAADARDDDSYRRAHVDGLANSSTSVYAQDDGGWVDESSPTQPAQFSGQRVLEGERIAPRAGCEAVVLRLGGIYGPGRSALLERVRSGQAQLPHAPHYTNRIHRDDAARACAHLLALATPAACYVGVDHEPAERGEVLRWLAARLGVPPPRGAHDPNAAPSGKRCNSELLRASGFAFSYPTFREGYAAPIGAP